MRTKPGLVMRGTLFSALTAMVLASGLSACTAAGSGGGSGQMKAGGRPVSGGTLTYAVNQAQTTLDPAVSAADVTGIIDLNIFDSLVEQTGPDTFKPWLATSWSVSADGRTYTFHLKKGVVFQDGTPFTADAVKKTLDHAVAPATKSQYAGSLIAPYTGTTVVDPLTAQVRLSHPFAPFLQALSTPYLGIQSPKALTAPASSYRPVGTGPFSFVSWSGQKNVVLSRSPRYTSWPSGASHTGPAYLDRIQFDLVTEDSTRFGALTSHQAQAVASVPPVDAKVLKSSPGLRLLSHETPGANFNVYVNTTRGTTKDVRVRQALQASLDIPSLVKSVYFGQYEPARNTISASTAYYDPAAAGSLEPYDPAKAARLLDAAGWTGRDSKGYRTKDGQELDIEWPYTAEADRQGRDTLAEGMQDQAKKVGINLQRPSVAVGTFVSDIQNGTYNLLDTSFGRAEPDILRLLFSSDQLVSKGGANASLAHSAQLDGWLAEASTTQSGAVRKRDYALAQAYVLQNAFVIPCFGEQTTIGVSDELQGVGFTQQAVPSLYGAWLAR